jgi:proline iminopeptidase
MVTWSLETLQLALDVIAILSSAYIIFKTMRQSTRWGAFMLATFAAFLLLRHFAGPLIAGIVVIAAQAYYMSRPYTRKMLGRIYAYVVLCWGGSTYLHARDHGWIPSTWMRSADAVQLAGTAATGGSATEGFVARSDGRMWYRRSGTASGTPLVLLHGGPGIGSFYLKPLEALGADRPVVRYDQLGAGRSDVLVDTARFTIAKFVEDLDSLRAALGYERMHVLGHGWGSILAVEYYRANRDRVASLILGSPPLSAAAWTRHTRTLLATLPDTLQQIIAAREAAADFDAPDFAQATQEYRGRYVWLRPSDTNLDSIVKTANRALYTHMWGPSDFTLRGTLRDYEAARHLRRVRVPTLFTVGEFDQAGPMNVRGLARLTPGATIEVIPDAAHMTTWDNPEATIRVVRAFLARADSLAADTAR